MEQSSYTFLLRLLGLFIFVLIMMTAVAAFVPQKFPVGTEVRIVKNSSLSEIADSLAEKNVITSPFLFKVAVVLMQSQKKVVAGIYSFDKPENLWTVIRRLTTGEQGLKPIRVTIPEGSTVEDIAFILLRRIPDFNAPYFLKIAEAYEGYLFPDTYVFYKNTTPTEVLAALRKNFDMKLREIAIDIDLSRRSVTDVVTMASIIEREAASTTDRGIISGILWKRLDENMPLQVDATIVYFTGRAYTSHADLKIDSPYNTYMYKGLPKGPISNPGLGALRAAAQPVKTPYYYYLSDLRGKIHYATTFEGHQVNREKYLRK